MTDKNSSLQTGEVRSNCRNNFDFSKWQSCWELLRDATRLGQSEGSLWWSCRCGIFILRWTRQCYVARKSIGRWICFWAHVSSEITQQVSANIVTRIFQTDGHDTRLIVLMKNHPAEAQNRLVTKVGRKIRFSVEERSGNGKNIH